MNSSLVRVALNALRNQKPVIVPSSYSNTYSIVEVDTSLSKAWQIYNKECKKNVKHILYLLINGVIANMILGNLRLYINYAAFL